MKAYRWIETKMDGWIDEKRGRKEKRKDGGMKKITKKKNMKDKIK